MLHRASPTTVSTKPSGSLSNRRIKARSSHLVRGKVIISIAYSILERELYNTSFCCPLTYSRYYKDGSELTLDVGPFMKGMEVCIINLLTLLYPSVLTIKLPVPLPLPTVCHRTDCPRHWEAFTSFLH